MKKWHAVSFALNRLLIGALITYPEVSGELANTVHDDHLGIANTPQDEVADSTDPVLAADASGEAEASDNALAMALSAALAEMGIILDGTCSTS